jgi:integrase
MKQGRPTRRAGEVTTPRRAGDGWTFDWYSNGDRIGTPKRHQVKRATRQAIDIEHRRVIERLALHVSPDVDAMTFGQLAAQFLARPYKNVRTQRSYESRWRTSIDIAPWHWSRVPLSDINPADFEDWYRAIGSKVAVYDVFMAIIGYGVKKRYLPHNPLARQGLRGVPKGKANYFTLASRATFKRMEHELPERYRMMSMTAMATGTRPGELRALRRADVDFDNLTVTIRAQLIGGCRGKRGTLESLKAKEDDETRMVHVNPKFLLKLSAWITRHHVANPDDLIFTDEAGWPISNDLLNRMVRDARKAIGLNDDNYSAHGWRHMFGMSELDNGANPKDVQLALGHDRLTTTLVYLHGTGKRPASSDVVDERYDDTFAPEPNVVHADFHRPRPAPLRVVRSNDRGRRAGSERRDPA